MIERILVPLDGSQMAESVLPVVTALASCTGSTVIFLHIIEERPPRSVHGEPHLSNEAESEAYLVKLGQSIPSTVRVEHHVHATEEHDVALSIASHAAELDISMVILCTHGRSGPRRVVWGSIAQQVIRRTTVPVLLARPDMHVPTRITTLLVALDGTPAAEAAIPVAEELAKVCASNVVLARVVPTAGTLTGDEAAVARLVPTATDATLDAEATQAVIYLDEVAARVASHNIPVRHRVLRGDPVQMLTEAAAKADASVIVIATHGRAGLGALWIGSVGAGLMGSARCPLLLVRIPDGQAGDKD
ncbi:MAG: universal stress protein [Chloroflexota bacterium]